MNFLRKILFPFAVLYGLITLFRNFLFDNNILKSTSFDVPIIAVGNLSVGGTGKTPQIEYLINLLSNNYDIATLSRGYKRESKGFILADSKSDAKKLGDEPYQFYKKFQNIQVAVDADRTNGIKQLLKQEQKPTIILLDDAYQHRKVKAGFYILLTAYSDLFYDDFMLPTGNLREYRNGCNRANAIIVTKCPENLSQQNQNEIEVKINKYLKKHVPIFFTSIQYDNEVFSNKDKLKIIDILNYRKVLLAGIAKPEPFFSHLKSKNDIILKYSDHHNFTDDEIIKIKNKAQNNIIITTEKDFVRLNESILKNKLYYLPIKSNFLQKKETFNNLIINYIENKLPEMKK
jgi:tetraacyldisaccharide 4'-kinase